MNDTNRLIRYFPNADLRNGHFGLAKMAKANNIDVTELESEFVIFTNRSRTGLKMFAPGNIVAYLKTVSGQKIDLNLIRGLPKYFNGTEIKYNDALKKKIERDLKLI